MEDNLIRIPPDFYIHVLDGNTNLTRIIEGPNTCALLDQEQLVSGKSPQPMILIPPQHYCIIKNPVIKSSSGEVIEDDFGMAKVKYGDREIRTSETHPRPFPLYPLELLDTNLTKIPVIKQNQAFMLIATMNFQDTNGARRVAGNKWLIFGPRTYIPRRECEILKTVDPLTIRPNYAIKIRAIQATKDYKGNERKAGEEWLIRESGDYLLQVREEFVEELKPMVLTEKSAIQLRASTSFTDVYGRHRKAGEEWLLSIEETDIHLLDVYETLVGTVKAIVLNNRQYCYVLDPVDVNGKNQLGQKKLVQGDRCFFLKPFERLENEIQDIIVLADDEALLLKAAEVYTSPSGQEYLPGEKWMIYGPCDFIPPPELEVVERRKSIPLAENEGVYIRDMITGEIKAKIGKSYMLAPQEVLYELPLPDAVEQLIFQQKIKTVAQRSWSYDHKPEIYVPDRDKTRVVSFSVPHNSAVQVYHFVSRESRTVFGPDRIMLQPDEQFTVVELSGGAPKKEKIHQSLALLLGPDFMTDHVVVETSDHANLCLKLSYNWRFRVDRSSAEDAEKIFRVKDFVGDACKTIASRIRGAVSMFSFEDFHQRSADIIKAAVFGKKGDVIKGELYFPVNSLLVTSVDIQSVEPTDEKTKMSLKKSVIQAIEITTESNKMRAMNESSKNEEVSKGRLELQKVGDLIEAEKEKIKVARLKGKNSEVQLIGKAAGEALAEAKAKKIYYQSLLEQVELEEQAKKIENDTELALLQEKNQIELEYIRMVNELEINKARELASIQIDNFKQAIEATGKDTIVSMARAGPETQSRILKGLGLKGFMVMNSHNPINLFKTANGFLPSSK